MRAHLLFATIFVWCSSEAGEVCSGVYRLEDMGWYEEQMRAAEAIPLCATDSPEIERYRLVWLRSFHNPILVTLERNGRTVILHSVRLDGAGGYDPGRIIQRKTHTLTSKDFRTFRALLQKMDFWNLKSEAQIEKEAAAQSDDIVARADGAQWILEGANKDLAHSADRWSDLDGSFKEAAMFLLRKSGLNLNGPIY